MNAGREPPIGVPARRNFDVGPVIQRLAIPVGAPASAVRIFLDRAYRVIGALLVARIGNPGCLGLETLRQSWGGSFDPKTRDDFIAHVDACTACNELGRRILASSFSRRGRLGLAGFAPPVTAAAGLADHLDGEKVAYHGDVHRHAAYRDPADPPPGKAGQPAVRKPRWRKKRGPGRIGPERLLPFGATLVAIVLLLTGSSAIHNTMAGGEFGTGASSAAGVKLELSASVVDLGMTGASGSVAVLNSGGRPSGVDVTGEPEWLAVTLPEGEIQPGASARLTVAVDRARAPSEPFEARLSVKPAAGGDGAELFVVGNGMKPPAAFSISPGTIDLGATRVEDFVSVRNDGGRPAAVVVKGNPVWLDVTLPTGEIQPGGSARLTVAVDRATAPVGSFQPRLSVEPAGGGAGATLVVQGTVASPEAAKFTLSASEIDLGPSEQSDAVNITNAGGTPSGARVEADDLPEWISVTPPDGLLKPGSTDFVSIRVDRYMAPLGSFDYTIDVIPAEGGTGAALTIRGSVDPPAAVVTYSYGGGPGGGVVPMQVSAWASGSRPGSAPIVSYDFIWGDGTDAIGVKNSTDSHVYTAAGTYVITVRVNDEAGRSSSDDLTVKAHTPLAAPIPTSPNNGFTFDGSPTVTFTWAAVAGAASYSMDLEWFNGTEWVWADTLNTSAPSVSREFLLASSEVYRWQVRAVASDDLGRAFGEPSGWRTFSVYNPG